MSLKTVRRFWEDDLHKTKIWRVAWIIADATRLFCHRTWQVPLGRLYCGV